MQGTQRGANTDEVKELRREAKGLKEVVAEQSLELCLLKKRAQALSEECYAFARKAVDGDDRE